MSKTGTFAETIFAATIISLMSFATCVCADASAVNPARTISVTSVLYKAPNDWIVWINGVKVLPDRSTWLPEIYDMKVERFLVSLKWYDREADKVFNIALHPPEAYSVED